MSTELLELEHQPSLPTQYQPGIGIIGCGGIVRNAHLPAYQKYGLRVLGAYDISPTALQAVQDTFQFPTYAALEELLANPDIEVVDIATHPAARADLIKQALAAGKHVLSQKPLAPDLATARALVHEADERGLKLAVNQNGRYAPVWRIATRLVQQGEIGDVLAVTHLFEITYKNFVSTPFDAIPHFAIYDYAIHWFDSIRCWFGDTPIDAIRAREYRTPNQPAESQASWGILVDIAYTNGASACIRGVNCLPSHKGHPFWIHGTTGDIHGSVLGRDFVEMEKNEQVSRYQLHGKWFPDGFAGTMGELLCAIEEDRDPYNSARHNLLTLQMTLAACMSAAEHCRPVSLEEVQ